ncbi:MAG: zonular occludens toxin domain-containing protein [Pseudomonadota bacterium]
MPINAYTGLPGSGKSYECVVSVIIPAVAAGRDVVTNVSGIDSDAIRAYIIEHYKHLTLDQLGHVRHCKNEDVEKVDFLPHGTDAETFCKPGDLVCIDEAWKFWGNDCTLLKQHKIFFREHRHYVNSKTGITSDLVLMAQDISDLHRILRIVVELSFRMTKIKSLGLNKTYRVEMWEGHRQTIKARASVQNKNYNKTIFPLYSSYDGAGTESRVDGRQNILNNKTLWLYLVIMIVVGTLAGFAIKRFFSNPQTVPPKTVPARAPTSGTVKNLDGTIALNPNVNVKPQAPVQPKYPETSPDWRYAGIVEINGTATVVLASQNGSLRFESPSSFRQNGLFTSGEIEGKLVTRNTGQRHVSQQSAPVTAPAFGASK